MIQAGIISGAIDASCPYKADLKVDGITYGFTINNELEIPHKDRQALDCGDHVAGIFNFVEGDQFATYIPSERIVSMITKD